MTLCFIVASIISAAGVFAFLTNTFNNFGNPSPIMLELMLGMSRSTGSGFHDKIVWTRVPGMTLLFCIQIIIIVLTFVTWAISAKMADDIVKIVVSSISGFLSLIATILSFGTMNLFNVPPKSKVTLGPGPITYGVMQIISIVFLLIGIVMYIVEEHPFLFSRNSRRYSYSSLKKSLNTRSDVSISVLQSKEELIKKEKEKIEKLLEYKKQYDSGVLTKEEYDSKKKEIL